MIWSVTSYQRTKKVHVIRRRHTAVGYIDMVERELPY